MDKWISIKDRLPMDNNYYLTAHFDSNPSVRTHQFSTTFQMWNSNSGGPITHWMPLPEPPK